MRNKLFHSSKRNEKVNKTTTDILQNDAEKCSCLQKEGHFSPSVPASHTHAHTHTLGLLCVMLWVNVLAAAAHWHQNNLIMFIYTS